MKPITRIVIAFFILVAALHLIRLLFGWELTINGISIPLWASVIGLLIAGGLGFGLWVESKR